MPAQLTKTDSRIYSDVRTFSKSAIARSAFRFSCTKSISFGRFSRISSPSHVNSKVGNQWVWVLSWGDVRGGGERRSQKRTRSRRRAGSVARSVGESLVPGLGSEGEHTTIKTSERALWGLYRAQGCFGAVV